MSKFTRFEFGGTGIFHALEVLHDMPIDKQVEEDLDWAEREFNKILEFPGIFYEKKDTKDLHCFFTEKGLKAFETSLDILLSLFQNAEEAGLGEVQEIMVDSSNLNIVYEDEYQIVARISHQELEAML